MGVEGEEPPEVEGVEEEVGVVVVAPAYVTQRWRLLLTNGSKRVGSGLQLAVTGPTGLLLESRSPLSLSSCRLEDPS